MFKLNNILIILFFIILPDLSFAKKQGKSTTSKRQYNLLVKARLETNNGSPDRALKLLIDYRNSSLKIKSNTLMSFYVIESIGRIYLRVQQNPDVAIKFFSEALHDPNITDTNYDIISAWLGRAKEWKNLNMFPQDIKDPKKLFELGKKYYEHGINVQKFAMDVSASADFSLATTYLIPLTIYFDKDPNIGEALYMMGEIRRRSWFDNKYWTENFYLMEVIRRFSNTELAAKAYQALYEDVHFGYTGSNGDSTPDSWNELLKVFEILSKVKEPIVSIDNQFN